MLEVLTSQAEFRVWRSRVLSLHFFKFKVQVVQLNIAQTREPCIQVPQSNEGLNWSFVRLTGSAQWLGLFQPMSRWIVYIRHKIQVSLRMRYVRYWSPTPPETFYLCSWNHSVGLGLLETDFVKANRIACSLTANVRIIISIHLFPMHDNYLSYLKATHMYILGLCTSVSYLSGGRRIHVASDKHLQSYGPRTSPSITDQYSVNAAAVARSST